jgi:hypothetical protein
LSNKIKLWKIKEDPSNQGEIVGALSHIITIARMKKFDKARAKIGG